MKSGGECFWVVGDSAFSGIRIPTDEITAKIASDQGFSNERIIHIRDRRSRSGVRLRESIIVLRK